VLGYTVNVPLVEPLITFAVVETDGGVLFVPVAVTRQEPADAGAVNNPELLIVPQVVDQVTVAFAENCTVAFTSTVGFVGAMARGAGMLPDPDNATVCGLPLAESEILSVAARDQDAVGLNAIPIVQLLDPARLDPHVLLVIEKSPAFIPSIATLLIDILVVPSLCTVTVCAAVDDPMSATPKESVCGDTVRVLTFPVAFPESSTLSDELNPEWSIARLALREPAAVGVNVIVKEQSEEAARLVPQVLLDISKSPAFAPEIAMLLIAIDEVPMLLRVTVFGDPCDPIFTSPQVRLRGSMRTPATTHPISGSVIRREIEVSRRTHARPGPVPGWFPLRVKVPSSSFMLLGGKRIKPRLEAMSQHHSGEARRAVTASVPQNECLTTFSR